MFGNFNGMGGRGPGFRGGMGGGMGQPSPSPYQPAPMPQMGGGPRGFQGSWGGGQGASGPRPGSAQYPVSNMPGMAPSPSQPSQFMDANPWDLGLGFSRPPVPTGQAPQWSPEFGLSPPGQQSFATGGSALGQLGWAPPGQSGKSTTPAFGLPAPWPSSPYGGTPWQMDMSQPWY